MSTPPWDDVPLFDAPPPPWEDVPLFDGPNTEPPPWESPTAPAFDPATGEVLDPEPLTPGPLTYEEAIGRRSAPDAAVDDGSWDVGLVALTPTALAASASDTAAFTRSLREAIDGRLAAEYDRLRDGRDPGKPLEVAVEPELRYLTSAADTFTAVARVFTDAAAHARGQAGDIVLEVKPDDAQRLERKGGSASLRVGRTSSGGESVKVTVRQATETFADTDAILDVLVAHLIDERADLAATTGLPAVYAGGARDLAETVRGLTSPWSWKSSALDVLAGQLDDALKARLKAAYGRRPKGDPRTEVK